MISDGWYQLDTGWGCGGVKLKDGKVCEAAPIFKWLIGQKVPSSKKYKLVRLDEHALT